MCYSEKTISKIEKKTSTNFTQKNSETAGSFETDNNTNDATSKINSEDENCVHQSNSIKNVI